MDIANDTTRIIYAAGSSLGTDDFRRYAFNGSAYAGATSTTVLHPTDGAQTFGVYAIADGLGGETLYATSRNALYKIVDANPLASDFGILSMVKIADAPTGTEFRGLTGVPTPEPTTISLAGSVVSVLLAFFGSRGRR